MGEIKVKDNFLSTSYSTSEVSAPVVGSAGEKTVTVTTRFFPVKSSSKMVAGIDSSTTKESVVSQLAAANLQYAKEAAKSAATGVYDEVDKRLVDPAAEAVDKEHFKGKNANYVNTKINESETFRENGVIHNELKRQATTYVDRSSKVLGMIRQIVEEDPKYEDLKDPFSWNELTEEQRKELFREAMKRAKDEDMFEDGFYSPSSRDAVSRFDMQFAAFDHFAGTPAMAKLADSVTAGLMFKEDDQVNNITDSSGNWVNKNTFEEQIWLLKNFMVDEAITTVLKGGAQVSKDPPLGSVDGNCVYLFGKSKEDSEFFNSCLLHRSLLSVYNFLPTALHALLIPKIELFIEDYTVHMGTDPVKGVDIGAPMYYRKLVFDENLSKKELQDLIQGNRYVIPGTGLISLKLEDKAANAAEIRKNYVCHLKVHSNSIKDFHNNLKASDRHSNPARARFEDLWFGTKNGRKLKKLILQIGFQVPHVDSIARATGYNRRRSIDVRDAIRKNNLTFRLYLHKYNLDFKQNGSIEFSGTYQAAQASMIMDLDVFPVPYAFGSESKYRIPVYVPKGTTGLKGSTRKSYTPRQAIDLIPRLEAIRENIQSKQKDGKLNATQKNEIGSITKHINYIREEIQGIRYSGIMSRLMADSVIEVVQVSVDKDGALEAMNKSKIKKLSKTDDKFKAMDAAAKAALRNTRTTNRFANRSAITATKYHNTATEGDTHNIAFVRFGAIIESLNKNMAMNYGRYLQELIKKFQVANNLPEGDESREKIVQSHAFQIRKTKLLEASTLSNYQVHFGKAEIRTGPNSIVWVNVGMIPIAIPHLIKFLQGIYSSVPGSDAPFGYGQFIERAIDELLLQPLNSYDFYSSPARSRERAIGLTHRAFVKKLGGNKDQMLSFLRKSDPSNPNKTLKFGSKEQMVVVLGGHHTQNNRVGLKAKPGTFSGYSDIFRNSSVKYAQKKTASDQNISIIKEFDVFYIAIESVSPVYLQGNMAENLSKGIYHFIIGQDAGILKSVSFEQKDIKGRQEVILLSEDEGTDQLLHFDVKLKTVGNTLFSNGDLVFLDPGFHLHKDASQVQQANLFGLGGYYYVTKVNHTLSRDGYETELVAKWISDQGIQLKPSGSSSKKVRDKLTRYWGVHYNFLDAFSYYQKGKKVTLADLAALEAADAQEFGHEYDESELEEYRDEIAETEVADSRDARRAVKETVEAMADSDTTSIAAGVDAAAAELPSNENQLNALITKEANRMLKKSQRFEQFVPGMLVLGQTASLDPEIGRLGTEIAIGRMAAKKELENARKNGNNLKHFKNQTGFKKAVMAIVKLRKYSKSTDTKLQAFREITQ